jgi:signal transduction histidine kinase
VNDLLDEIAQKHGADEAALSGLDLDLDLSPDLPETYADGEVLRQAIENLVHNAVQALPSRDGRVLLSSRVVGENITISVSDTGPGIPDSIRGKIFDLYFTTKEGGTGVGLALVRQAIEMHGGDLNVDSEPGRGTCMTLRLPVHAPHPAMS